MLRLVSCMFIVIFSFVIFTCWFLVYLHYVQLLKKITVWCSFPFLRAVNILIHDALFLLRQSATCLSLFIHCKSISPLSFISVIIDISMHSLWSDMWLVVLALSCIDLLLVYVVICKVGGINDNSSPNWLMKCAVSAPSVNANVSAAKVYHATLQTFVDFHEIMTY